MYSLDAILRGIRKPREAVMEVNAVYNRVRNGCDYNPDGVDVFAEEWDALLLLDACRYDVFAAVADLPGALEKRVSRGGGTVEFLKGNFRGRDLRDTVYVTANPQFHRHRERLGTEFHAVHNVWQHEWDDDLHTVHPRDVEAAAREAREAYPHKRLFVHFNQPHTPYIGEFGRSLEIGSLGEDLSALETFRNNVFHHGATREEYRRAYRENLEVALPYAASLLDDFAGRTVVTGDHGEMLGERAAPVPIRYYSHRVGVHVPELVEVPWHVRESGDRPEVYAGETGTSEEGEAVSDDVVSERLRDLGYAE